MNIKQFEGKAKAYNIEDSSNLMKVEIKVMHDKSNWNDTKFSLDAMKKAESSIRNTPILGYILRDNETNDAKDFDGHNVETRIVDSDDGFAVETRYIEKPIGVIPESCNPRYEEIDGHTYFLVDGFIWKCYSNGADKLISNSDYKSVSMEISVLDGNFDDIDGLYDITNYEYLGVTCLGDHTSPAMQGACISKYDKSYKKDLEEIYQEIYSLERKEECSMDEEEVKEQEKVEDTDEVTEVVEEATEETEIEEDKENQNVEETEEFSLDLSCFSELLEEIPTDIEGLFNAIKTKFQAKDEQLNTVTSELEKLSAFKKSIDDANYESEIEDIVSTFGLDEEEIRDLKVSALNREITKEQFKEKVGCLYAIKDLNTKKSNKEDYSNKKNEEVEIKIFSKDIMKDEFDPYGGLGKKYLNK